MNCATRIPFLITFDDVIDVLSHVKSTRLMVSQRKAKELFSLEF